MEIITVQPGDTVNSIAEAYRLNADKIIADNGVGADGLLAVGQSLVLLFPAETHTAAAGETVSEVAARYGTDERTLFRNNFFLHGTDELPAGAQVVIRYENEPQTQKIIGGYAYDFIDDTLLNSVVSYMTYLIPFTYGFSYDGSLIPLNDERLLRVAREYGAMPLMHLSTLTEGGYFSNELAHELLNNPTAIQALYAAILENVRAKGYYGVDVDFEYLFAEDKDAYVSFIAGLTELLNENGYFSVVALPPKISDDQPGLLYEGVDYAALGAAADYSFLMTYECVLQ